MFATEFFSNFHNHVEVNGEAPKLPFHETGYLFLATKDGMGNLIDNHQIQHMHNLPRHFLRQAFGTNFHNL